LPFCGGSGHAAAFRRLDCPDCGVTVERVPWAERKGDLTTSYRWFLARWTKRLSWTDTAVAFNTTCDMWKPYLNVIAEQIPQALHVLDRFHIMRNMNVAIDEVRRQEVAQLRRDGYEPALTSSRWCLLRRPENLTDNQVTRLAELLQYNLKSVRAHLLREEFQRFWEYASPIWAGKFLESWCTRALRSRLAPMKKVAGSLRRHRPLILNWLLALGGISAGTVEGFNGKAKLTTRKAYGFGTPQGIEFALLHVMGDLPEPQFTHRFC
jgi:transposase